MRFTGLFVLALISIVASANTTLVDDLERVSPGNKNSSDKQIKALGYRIQVFAGNNTRAARNQADLAKDFIRQKYPEFPVYTYFRSPRWLCAVGDFLYYEEAYAVMRKLRSETSYKGLIILRNQEINLDL
jgi:hypothetical protein